jgi:transcriptional regulator with XRE-family HTH domain
LGIKRLREVAGLSQWSAARRTGIPRMRLSLAESGQLALNPEEEAALRQVLRESIQAQQARLNEVLRESVGTT